MNLHENKRLFADTILASAQYLDINPIFVEKDYWITRSLKLLVESGYENRAIFKGGTSLSKAHNIGARFSEDIDVAIIDATSLNGNQRKMLIKRLAKSMTSGLKEIPTPGVTSKGSSYYKAIYGYDRISELNNTIENTSEDYTPIKLGQIMVEINSFTNPYPYNDCVIDSFIGTFLRATGNNNIIREYGLNDFHMNVLDKKRTATEKIVSIIRFSFATDFENELSKKIRHFYDLYYLMNDTECRDYICSEEFAIDLDSLLQHDKKIFDEPEGWNTHSLLDSPLLNSLEDIWERRLSDVYRKQLSSLAYKSIPDTNSVLMNVKSIMDRIASSHDFS